MGDQPVGGGKNAAGCKHAEDLPENCGLVRHMHQRILGKDHIEAAVEKRQATGSRLHKGDVGEP
ncbi:hypothetical protein D9M69_642240 [compost metagenome]